MSTDNAIGVFDNVNDKLKMICNISEDKITNKQIAAKGITLIKLRDILIEIGTIIEEEIDNNTYVAYLPAGLKKKNTATVVFQLDNDDIKIASFAKEGLIKQHTSEGAINYFEEKLIDVIDGKTIEEEDNNIKKPKQRLIKIMLSVLILATLIIFGTNYSQKVFFRSSYNSYIRRYNSYVETISGINDRYQVKKTFLGTNPKQKNYIETLSEVDKYKNTDALSSLKKDTEELQKQISKLEKDVYYYKVDELNAEISNYKYIVDIVQAYNLDVSSDFQIETIQVDSNKKIEWSSFDSFTDAMSELDKKSDLLEEAYYNAASVSYNALISDYNLVAKSYNQLADKSVLMYIDGMNSEYKLIDSSKDISKYSKEELLNEINTVIENIQKAVEDYEVVAQITNPSEELIINKLTNISQIEDVQAVTKENDPNELLGKDGGYTSCIYFAVNGIKSNLLDNKDTIKKGTDGGGAIEIYENSEDALNRCDYLSQFDDTVLYTGSYTAVGTMVIRTSYLLDDKNQVDLTNSIIQEITSLDGKNKE